MQVEGPDDADARGSGIEADLLRGLTQGGRGHVGIVRLGLAAREADLARVVPADGPLDQDDPGLAGVVRVEEREHRGRPAGASRRQRRRAGAARRGRSRPA